MHFASKKIKYLRFASNFNIVLKMDYKFRCDCPFTSALDILGDKWNLVIVKQMLLEGKETFKDFAESEEAIATNILSSKLKFLEGLGIIIKTKRPDNKKANYYFLTDKGIALTPILLELAQWRDDFLRDIHPSILEGEGIHLLRKDKAAFAQIIEERYRSKLASVPQLHQS